MKKFVALFIIAMLAIIILIFLTNPDLLGKVWLYLLGFIGYLIVLLEKGYKAVAKAFKEIELPSFPKRKTPSSTLPVAVIPLPIDEKDLKIKDLEEKIHDMEKMLDRKDAEGMPLGQNTLTLLRYLNDGETTLGLLFLRNRFFSYTLEDTHQDEKRPGETRIPSGIYPVDFNRNDTELTLNYRKTRPWFGYHLEIKDIPDFKGVYIHVGNTHKDTKGCVLIADGVNAGVEKYISQSRAAFERFYKTISALLKSHEQVHLQIFNEDWFERSKLYPL